MKTACLIAATTLAGAVAPPRISLNLEGMTSAYELKNSIDRVHDLAYQNDNHHENGNEANTNPSGTPTNVNSRQDWTEKCPAGTATDEANCPHPVAKAYDHFDGKNIEVSTRIFLVDRNGTAVTGSNCPAAEKAAACHVGDGACCVSSVDYSKRATYLFKYDAQDKAGNHAEQIVFALILDDTTAPVYQTKCRNDGTPDFEAALTVEAVSDWRLCDLHSVDNIDGDVSDNIRYDIKYLNRANSVFDKPAGAWHSDTYKAVEWAGVDKSQITYASAEAYFNQCSNEGHTYDRLKFEAKIDGTTKTCGPTRVGKFLVTATTRDYAGVYGHNAVDNLKQIQSAILVQDTKAPTVYLEGHNPVFVECNRATYTAPDTTVENGADDRGYAEAGALCHDKLDSDALGKHLEVVISGFGDSLKLPDQNTIEHSNVYDKDIANFLSKVDGPNQVTRTLTYNCKDYALNAATEVTRTVTTVDTEAPTLTLNGGGIVQYQKSDCESEATCKGDSHMTHTAHSEANQGNGNTVDQGVNVCKDRCDETIDENDVTLSWGPKRFNARVLGDYVRTYSVTDAHKNVAMKHRTFTVIDNEIPVITIQGGNAQECTANADSGLTCTYEASRDVEYTDAGATCEDWVDGELSHAVEVSGEVVNYRIPGTYVITYNCQDLTGNTAEKVERTVIIQDDTSPYLSLNGAIVNFIEAGFPYVDAGATATDTLDGDITQYIWTDGNTVNDRRANYAAHSCAALPKSTPSGEYYLTTKDTEGKFHRVLVHCYIHAGAHTGVKVIRQHTGAETPAAVCASKGMQVCEATDTACQTAASTLYPTEYSSFDVATATNFVCQEIDNSAVKSASVQNTINSRDRLVTDELQNAEQGKYIINFRVEDKAGNSQQNILSRTVIVKDTLPPVVSLSIQQKLNAETLAAQTLEHGHNHGHEFYMAETSTSANGFLIGAVASAVAGVALLGVSMRKTSTSVPV